MADGMYTALSGAKVAMKQVEVIANNLANANTPGYKALHVLFENWLSKEATPEASIAAGQVHSFSKVAWTDFSAGGYEATGNMLDLAVDGEGYFMVERGGQTMLTRDGAFHRNEDGYLVNADGFMVLNESQSPIQMPEEEVVIDAQGQIFGEKGLLDRVGMVRVTDPESLTRMGRNLLKPAQGEELLESYSSRVMQGYVEGSNVNPVKEMVDLITAHRHFDLAQNAIKTQQQINQQRNQLSKES